MLIFHFKKADIHNVWMNLIKYLLSFLVTLGLFVRAILTYKNNYSYFANFSKRVQGLSIAAKLGSEQKTEVFASGALVRGQFTTSQFTAQEGNQGPYKLRGPNGELFVLIVSGSEIVYVNGIPLERGETKDYIIDYNAGEILFNATYPITSEMRITVDYQFTDRNYSRIVSLWWR